ncbi:MAG: hypothetical protein LBJ39_01510 [Tannerellaceae bacterium]|jgi:hypothetical protein|nr:hypothetical protein [Tannerellaceae bacterium]
MAKNKKTKKVQPPYQKRIALPGKYSNAYLESCYATVRRIFRAIGEDESSFDLFTKRQKQKMFLIAIPTPRVAAMKGHTVPRHYISYVQEMMVSFMKRSYFNEEEGVTWMDMLTIGQSLMMVFHVDSFRATLQGPQLELADRVFSTFESQKIYPEMQKQLAGVVRVTLMTISQPNFRIYGQNTIEHMDRSHMPAFRQMIYIVTHESQPLRFKYRNKERTAFRIAMGQHLYQPYTGATIPISKILPDVKRDRELDIYIQSHAIHRFKERIDTLHPVMRNEYFVLSLMIAQKLVKGPSGMHYIACIMPVDSGTSEVTIGYFAFTIDGDNLLVLTLLPLLSKSVPEGGVLYDRLHLSPEDLKYLGMDKLSFFYDVDIEQIPILKQVLFDELHLDYVHTLYNSNRDEGDRSFNEKKTLFVKNYFQDFENRLPQDDLDQITGTVNTETDISEYE